MLPCVFVLVALGLQLPNPSLTRKRKGITSLSAFRPDTARWSHGQTGPAHLQRGLTTGSRGRDMAGAGQAAGPHPRSAAEPRAGPAVLGDGAGSGSPSSRALSATPARPCGRGRGKTRRGRRRRHRRGLSLEQAPGSLTAAAPSPSAPFPGPGPPGASTRPPPAQPGPYGSPPLV